MSVRLTAEQKQEIRALYAAGGVKQRELAERFGVSQNTISKVVIYPPRLCPDCGTEVVKRERCERCAQTHLKKLQHTWQVEHKEHLNQRQSARWHTNERHRNQHRVTARESWRRMHPPKRKRETA